MQMSLYVAVLPVYSIEHCCANIYKALARHLLVRDRAKGRSYTASTETLLFQTVIVDESWSAVYLGVYPR